MLLTYVITIQVIEIFLGGFARLIRPSPLEGGISVRLTSHRPLPLTHTKSDGELFVYPFFRLTSPKAHITSHLTHPSTHQLNDTIVVATATCPLKRSRFPPPPPGISDTTHVALVDSIPHLFTLSEFTSKVHSLSSLLYSAFNHIASTSITWWARNVLILRSR